jgi:eukaryotic translation initiation factor 2C
MRGVYSSIRLCELTPSMGNGPGTGLALNVDVANGTFWTSQDVHQAARNLCKARNRNLSYQVFRDQLLPVKDPKKPGVWTQSNEFKELRKMAKLKFRVKHRGKQNDYKDCGYLNPPPRTYPDVTQTSSRNSHSRRIHEIPIWPVRVCMQRIRSSP